MGYLKKCTKCNIEKDGVWDKKHFEEWLLTNKIIK